MDNLGETEQERLERTGDGGDDEGFKTWRGRKTQERMAMLADYIIKDINDEAASLSRRAIRSTPVPIIPVTIVDKKQKSWIEEMFDKAHPVPIIPVTIVDKKQKSWIEEMFDKAHTDNNRMWNEGIVGYMNRLMNDNKVEDISHEEIKTELNKDFLCGCLYTCNKCLEADRQGISRKEFYDKENDD